jgi:hypothetical protein
MLMSAIGVRLMRSMTSPMAHTPGTPAGNRLTCSCTFDVRGFSSKETSCHDKVIYSQPDKLCFTMCCVAQLCCKRRYCTAGG